MGKKGNVVVDIGNSIIKVAIFLDDKISLRTTLADLREVRASIGNQYERWIFSSVGDDNEQIRSILTAENFIILSHHTPLPITLDYHTPETLGRDRIAAVVAAHHQFGGQALVIDAGSCITYDLIDKGVYRGGVIAPGLKMRMRAMAHFTRQLPDISEEWEKIPHHLLGKSTRECLLKGSLDAASHEMQGFIDQYVKEYPDLRVILTGGDANYFESRLKAPIFADFDLVLSGLNRILNHNK